MFFGSSSGLFIAILRAKDVAFFEDFYYVDIIESESLAQILESTLHSNTYRIRLEYDWNTQQNKYKQFGVSSEHVLIRCP